MENEKASLTSDAGDSELSEFVVAEKLTKEIPVSLGTIRNWTKAGKLPCVRINGSRRVLYHMPSVREALLRQQRGGGLS